MFFCKSILEEYLFDVFNFFTMKPTVDILERCNNGIGLFTLEVRDKFILKLFLNFLLSFFIRLPSRSLDWLIILGNNKILG